MEYTEPLLEAASRGDAVAYQTLLESGADVNTAIDGYAPILIAAWHGNDSVIELLLEKKDINIYARDTDGRTALALAAIRGHDRIADLLIKASQARVPSSTEPSTSEEPPKDTIRVQAAPVPKHKINTTDKSGATPLLLAIRHGHQAIVERLLEVPDINVHRADVDGWSPLLMALEKENLVVVRLLLQRDDFTLGGFIGNKGGSTLAPGARSYGSAVNMLLEEQGQILGPAETVLWAIRVGDETFIDIALDKYLVDIAESDDLSGIPSTTTHQETKVYAEITLKKLIQEGYTPATRRLLTHAALNVNARDLTNNTALSYAVWYEQTAMVEALLERSDIDVNARVRRGCTALHNAIVTGRETVCLLLLGKEGVDVNAKNDDEETVLHYAARVKGMNSVVERLSTMKDVNFNAQNDRGRTALYYAARSHNAAAAKSLLNVQGLDPNTIDVDGDTPLQCVVRQGNEEIAALLLSQEGLVVQDKVLQIAIRDKRDGIVERVLELDAVDVDKLNEKGQTAVQLAARCGNEEAVRLIVQKHGFRLPGVEQGSLPQDLDDDFPSIFQAARREGPWILDESYDTTTSSFTIESLRKERIEYSVANLFREAIHEHLANQNPPGLSGEEVAWSIPITDFGLSWGPAAGGEGGAEGGHILWALPEPSRYDDWVQDVIDRLVVLSRQPVEFVQRDVDTMRDILRTSDATEPQYLSERVKRILRQSPFMRDLEASAGEKFIALYCGIAGVFPPGTTRHSPNASLAVSGDAATVSYANSSPSQTRQAIKLAAEGLRLGCLFSQRSGLCRDSLFLVTGRGPGLGQHQLHAPIKMTRIEAFLKEIDQTMLDESLEQTDKIATTAAEILGDIFSTIFEAGQTVDEKLHVCSLAIQVLSLALYLCIKYMQSIPPEYLAEPLKKVTLEGSLPGEVFVLAERKSPVPLFLFRLSTQQEATAF